MKRKLKITATLILIILAVIILLGLAPNAVRPARICQPYIVSKGETLWEISEQFTKGDKWKWVYEVRDINGIKGSIYPGEVIYVFKEEK